MADSTNPLDEAFLDEQPEHPAPEPEPQQEPDTGEPEQQAEAQAEPDAGGDPDGSDPDAQAQPEPQQRSARVPLSEHLHEREKRQAAEARAQAIEQQMQSLQRQMEAMRSEAKPKEPAKEPDWYDDPQAATQHYVAPHIDQINQRLMYNARLAASGAYGQDKVQAAQEAFDSAINSGAIDHSEYQRVMNAPNPFEAAVQWHQKQTVLQEVGTDPAAYKQRIIDEAMKDPEVRKRILESVQAEARQPATNDRPATATRLPPSLNSRTSAASQNGGTSGDPGDMFSDAFSGMR